MAEPISADQFGFSDPASLSHATRALLEHLQRIGISQLQVTDAASIAGRLDLLGRPSSVTAAAHSRPASLPAAQPVVVPKPPTHAAPTHAAPIVRAPQTPVPQGRLAPASAIDDGPERYTLPVMPAEQRQSALNAMAAEVRGCQRCAELAYVRKQTVFGEGSPAPRVIFFGEAPGADEDRMGRPFVGKAGQLLTKMIEACTLTREECYILNTIKCRPPGNRNPQLDEVENCRGYFEHQLEILRPEYVVCLGLVAARALLRSPASVGRLRGVFHRYRESKVLVTYHPAYLLRNPEAKRAAWEDLQIMLRDMGIDTRPGRGG